MAKSNKQIKPRAAAAIVGVIVLILAGFWIVDDLKPLSLDDSLDFYGIEPVEGTSFKSENMTINDTDYYVYATLNRGAAEDGTDEYIVTVGKLKGIRRNQNDFAMLESMDDSFVFPSGYTNVSNAGNFDVTKGSEYYGTVCYGTVPLSCTSLVIGDVPAKLVRQTFEVNGKQADFYIYYCAIYLPAGSDDWIHDPEAIATDKNGHTYSIYTAYDDSTGLYGSTVKQIR